MKKLQRVYYYTDPLNDDFALNEIKKKPLPSNFKFHHRSWLYRFLSCLIYFVIAVPILWCFAKIRYGFKVVGKKKLKKLKLTGYFLYGNHALDDDSYLASVSFNLPRKTYVVANQAVTSIFGIRWFVMMLGALPVPENPEEVKKFLEALECHYRHRDVIMIFPVSPHLALLHPHSSLRRRKFQLSGPVERAGGGHVHDLPPAEALPSSAPQGHDPYLRSLLSRFDEEPGRTNQDPP